MAKQELYLEKIEAGTPDSAQIDYHNVIGRIEYRWKQSGEFSSMEGLVAIALLLGGGLKSLQAAALATGLPFSFVLLSALLGRPWHCSYEIRR